MGQVEAPIIIREAREEDVPAIAAILAGDTMGGHGDSADPAHLPAYMTAFRIIAASPREMLYVAERSGEVIGTFQTLLTTTLSGRGRTVMIIEAVQTRADCRGRGVGSQMIRFCVDHAKEAGLDSVQLTSNAARTDAHRFYERLGFAKSHFGFKMRLK